MPSLDLKNKHVCIVGANVGQCKDVYRVLEPYTASCEMVVSANLKNNGDKNPLNLSVFYHLSRAIFLSANAEKSFSCMFAARYRKYKKWTLIYRLIYYTRNQVLASIIFSWLETVFIYVQKLQASREGSKRRYDVVIYCGIFSTDIELKSYFAAINDGSTKIYWPVNWDNAHSKLPNFVQFDKTIFWSNYQMDSLSGQKFFGHGIVKRHPRLVDPKYIRTTRRSGQYILFAMSQKSNKSISVVFKELQNLSKTTDFDIVVRPHPNNVLKPSDEKLIEEYGLFLDSAYVKFLRENRLGGVPGSCSNFLASSKKSLLEHFRRISLLLCEAGTLCLEARSIGIPVGIIATNRWQITARNFLHFDHFRPLTQRIGIHIVLNDEFSHDLAIWLKQLDENLPTIDDIVSSDTEYVMQ